MQTPPFEPTQFGRYQLVDKLAVGGMAEIFKAKAFGAHGFEKTLVVKRILPSLAQDAEFVEMFIDEARVMVQLNHPKVVQVLDFGEVKGQYYIAMEYVQGVDGLALLRTCARRRCRPTTSIAVQIIADVLDGLDYAHGLSDATGKRLNLVHRDISPSNIFISEQGEVKLGDFGIARAEIRSRHTQTGALKGKYGYMAPEVVNGGVVDHRADLFSVGVVLAELLMIRRLYIAPSELEVLLQVRDARLDRLDKYGGHIPPELRQILENALTRDAGLRYQDAASFRDALHRYLFDQKMMVRSTDVRRFLQRLSNEEQLMTPSSELQPLPVQLSCRPGHEPSGEISVDEAGVQLEQPERYAAQPKSSAQRLPPPAQPAPASPPLADEPGRVASSDSGLASLKTVEHLTRRRGRSGTEYHARSGERLRLVSSNTPSGDQLKLRLVGKESAEESPLPSLEVLAQESAGRWPVESPSLGGRKRKILLGPPPRSEPVPAPQPESEEERRLRTDEVLAVVGEMDSGGAARDFQSKSDHDSLPLPEVEELVTPPAAADVAASCLQMPAEEGSASARSTFRGELSQHSLFRVLFKLAVAEETGLLTLRTDEAVREIFLVDGDPQYVSSNLPDELFGQYLMQKGVLSQGELSMALAMLPRFEGKLGNTLVALKLLRPVQVLRHLTHQVRQKLLNAFACQEGSFLYFTGRVSERESAPLGLDAFEVMGAGVLSLPEALLIRRLQEAMDKRPRSVTPPGVPPEVFRLGARPRQVFDDLDGRFTLIELLRRFDDPDQRQMFARMVYLLLETGLATIT